jgi:putative membrane protein|tara:strand:+ start:1360 stop:1869 length:510 start_codon:yes stop_codon:yes gene_type:complete
MTKRIPLIIWLFTAVVYALVIGLHELPAPNEKPFFTAVQPLLHAILNGTCFLVLLFSLWAIKNKDVVLHKKLNTAAMCLSVLFLLSYVVYHYLADDTIYGGNYKTLYYVILSSHIILAAASLPAILFAYYRGYIGDIQTHRKIVRYTYPVWLYVTLTGVLVYLFLKDYY